jgi:hypothetical protein
MRGVRDGTELHHDSAPDRTYTPGPDYQQHSLGGLRSEAVHGTDVGGALGH